MGLAYFLLKVGCSYTTKMFFRDINVINEENVPKKGATIIYGNHNNQFVDGILLLSVIPRNISFIAAAISCRRFIIGDLIRMSGAIPVERPQDMAKKGEGMIIFAQNGKVRGLATKFSSIEIGSSLIINNSKNLQVKAIISDIQLEINVNNFILEQGKYSYKIIPKLDYNALYENVWNSLREQKCIGIFPQGGSHDNLSILPLKAGICIMALGAADKYNIPIKLVPCGFNYYNPQNFRSKVIMQFGPTYQIPLQLVQLYRNDRKQAISILLKNLENMLKSCVTEFQSFNELSTLFICRELYTMNSERKIETKEKLILNRRLAKGFEFMRKRPQYKQEYDKLLKFTDFMELNGLHINKENYFNNIVTDITRFIFYFLKCFFRLFITLPGLVLMVPTTTIITYMAERQRLKCLKSSSVKVKGHDVVGSYKILVSLFLFPATAFLHSVALYYLLKYKTNLENKMSLKISIALFCLLPIYAFLMVKSLDSFGRSWKKLKYLFIRIFKRSIYNDFNREKNILSNKIRQLVEKHGSKVIKEFEQNRIIQNKSSNLFIFDEDNDNGKF